MNLYISDLHFGHANCIRFDERPFSDVYEMDYMLIQYWNNRVHTDDHVYVIGDMFFRNEEDEQWYLEQLKGHKHLIVGNHDSKLLNNAVTMSFFESVHEMLLIKDEDKEIVLCHYPMASWAKSHHGTWHIYGHIYNDKGEVYEYMKLKPRALNAGCMINNYAPASLRELVQNNNRFIGEDVKSM